MDSQTPDHFFTLIKSALYGTPLSSSDFSSPIRWPEIIKMAEKQTLLGLVIDAASRLPASLQPAEDVRALMLQKAMGIMKSHLLLDKTVAQVTEYYRKEGIEGVLLKGQGVARCYRDPKMRQCGDIDFYIGKKNYPRSVELASTLENSTRESTESVKHYHFNIGKVTVELHRIASLMYTPGKSKKFERWVCSQLEDPQKLRHLSINGCDIRVPSANFNAFFIFYHAWHHFFRGGIGLRQLCDWAMVLKKDADEIDREELKEVLDNFGLLKAWQMLGQITVERLGLEPSLMPFYNPREIKNREWVFQRIMEGGNFGFHTLGKPVALRDMPLVKRKMYLLKRLITTYFHIFSIIPVELTCFSLYLLSVGSVNTIKQLTIKK